ncbi:uncharacterized protein METZ01_LOCUS356143, partial [marine metagenome]
TVNMIVTVCKKRHNLSLILVADLKETIQTLFQR